MTWRHGRPWAGQPAVLLGGGPSLTPQQIGHCRARSIRTIAINNAYRIAPWADILYFCDLSWWGQHAHYPAFRDFAGIKATISDARYAEHLTNTGDQGLDFNEGCVRTGWNGGMQALNLAINLGATPIVLLGFDLCVDGDRTHWHDGHASKYSPELYTQSFQKIMLPAFDAAAALCREKGIVVINSSPGTALHAFPKIRLEEALP